MPRQLGEGAGNSECSHSSSDDDDDDDDDDDTSVPLREVMGGDDAAWDAYWEDYMQTKLHLAIDILQVTCVGILDSVWADVNAHGL